MDVPSVRSARNAAPPMLEAEVREKFADNGQRAAGFELDRGRWAQPRPRAVLLLNIVTNRGIALSGGFHGKQGNTAGADLSQFASPHLRRTRSRQAPRPLLTNKLERIGSFRWNSRPTKLAYEMSKAAGPTGSRSAPRRIYAVAQIQKQFFPGCGSAKPTSNEAAIASHNKTENCSATTPVSPDEAEIHRHRRHHQLGRHRRHPVRRPMAHHPKHFATFTTDQPVRIMIGTPKAKLSTSALTVEHHVEV